MQTEDEPVSEPFSQPAPEPAHEDAAPAGNPWPRRIAVAAGVLVLVAAGSQAGPYLRAFQAWVAELGFWGPLAFIAGYAVATVAFAPGAILTLAAGPIFGIVQGTAYVWVGATLGSLAAFLVARYVARGAVEQRVRGMPRFAAIDRAIARDGRRIVLLLRLSPVFPFNLLNYALGLTRIGFRDYAIASVGMLPGTLLYVYIGAVGGQAAVAASDGAQTTPLEWAYYVFGLTVTAVVTVLVTRTARRALAEADVALEEKAEPA